MPTSLLAQVRDEIKAKLLDRGVQQKERDTRQAELDSIITTAENERRDLDSMETVKFEGLRDEIRGIDDTLKTIDADLEGLEGRQALIVEAEEAKDAAKRASERWAMPADDKEDVARPARVKSEARTYTAESERRGTSFLRDVYQHKFFADPEAATRLERHVKEARLHEAAGYERRAVGTGAFAGLTVPQYLTDLVAPLARAMAPTVEIANRHPLPPDGMTVNISRITTGTAVAAQATENSGVQNTDMDDTLLTVNVRTYSGQQDIARQALERGTGVDEIAIQDLVRAYWTTLDNAILNADGTSGTHLGIRSTSSIVAVTYTDATPTAAELYPKLADLIQQIQAGVYMGVTHFVMHPRRWWWLAKEVGTSFPFLTVPSAGQQQAGVIGGTDYMGVNRSVLGVPVVVDGNMVTNLGAGTNEDVIIGVTNSELHLWHDDGGPLFIRAEPSIGSLQVKFVVYSYSAFAAGRYPGAHGTIGGTGLITPTF